MFSPEAVKKAQAQLDRLERATHIPIVIETIESIPGLITALPLRSRESAINALAVRRDKAIQDEGIYILISQERPSELACSGARTSRRLSRSRNAMRFATRSWKSFKKHDFDGGFDVRCKAIERALEGASVGHKAAHAPGGAYRWGRNARGGQSTMGTFLLIILGIFGVLLVLRLLGGLFGRSAGAGYPNQMGGMGMPRPGHGPGGPGYYGGPGYGGAEAGSSRACWEDSAERWRATGSTTSSPGGTAA